MGEFGRQVLQIEGPILGDGYPGVEIAERYVIDFQAERAEDSFDAAQLQALPLQQVFVVFCVETVEGAYAEGTVECPVDLLSRLCQAETQPGIHRPSGDGQGQVVREIGIKIPQRDSFQFKGAPGV